MALAPVWMKDMLEIDKTGIPVCFEIERIVFLPISISFYYECATFVSRNYLSHTVRLVGDKLRDFDPKRNTYYFSIADAHAQLVLHIHLQNFKHRNH